jgi:hypothetical protein
LANELEFGIAKMSKRFHELGGELCVPTAD